MQFSELVLHNVGVYKGRQAIDLTTSPGRPVILVGGLNGCGKTTFLDALQMALYGRRARLSNRGSQSWEGFLRESINRSVPDNEGASIELTFQIDLDGQNRNYRVVRSWSAHGKAIKEFVTVFLDGKVDPHLSSSWGEHIEELLPLEIAGLFFFDGEKIESLADPETASSVVRTAIHSLLGVGTLEQLRTDLLALQRRQIPPGDDDELHRKIDSLIQERSRLVEDIDLVGQRAAGIETRRRDAAKQVTAVQAAFERDGGNLYAQRKELELERARTSTQIQAIKEQLRTVAEGPLPLALVAGPLKTLDSQSKLEASIHASRQLLEHIELRDARVVERLTAPARVEVEVVLAEERVSLAEVALAETPLGLSDDVRRQLDTLTGAVLDAQAVAEALVAQLTTLEIELDGLDSRLAGVPHDDAIAALLAQRAESRELLAHLEGEAIGIADEKGRLAGLLETCESELNSAEANRRESVAKSDYVNRVLEHTDRVRDTLTTLRTRLIERHIGKIEVATLDAFQSLMRKSGLVQDLRIDESDFTVHLIGSDGEELPSSRLSAGERQLLAVALLWGLARVAGNRLPTVIDTPLGRLDSKHRKHLVERYFPQASSQVLLLSTDKEIDEELLVSLLPSLSKAYVLSHDDTKHTTTIESGYWWPLEAEDVA